MSTAIREYLTEQQQKEVEQALASLYNDPCHIEDIKPVKLLHDYSTITGIDNAFWVLVSRPYRITRTVLMLEVKGIWRIGEIPWITIK